MAASVASLSKAVDELREELLEAIGNLNDQLADLEGRIDSLEDRPEPKVDGRKTRKMTPEQRVEAGRRLQQARADKLGLDTIEQLHALKLRPGTVPTKAQIAAVKKEFPAKAAKKSKKG